MVNKLNKLKKQKNNYFFISLFLITVILISGCGQFSRVQETKEGTRPCRKGKKGRKGKEERKRKDSPGRKKVLPAPSSG